MTPEQRADARARCEAASKPKWTAEEEVDRNGFKTGKLWIVMRDEPCAYGFDSAEDAEFCASARTDLPLALDALDSKDWQIAKLRAAIAGLVDEIQQYNPTDIDLATAREALKETIHEH